MSHLEFVLHFLFIFIWCYGLGLYFGTLDIFNMLDKFVLCFTRKQSMYFKKNHILTIVIVLNRCTRTFSLASFPFLCSYF